MQDHQVGRAVREDVVDAVAHRGVLDPGVILDVEPCKVGAVE